MARSVSGVVLSWFFTVIALIILVLVANFIAYLVPLRLIVDLVGFLNANILLLVFASVFFYAGALFYGSGAPLNFLSPPSEGVGSVFMAAFLMNFISLIDSYAYTGISALLDSWRYVIYVLVFVLVVVLGYVHLLKHLHRKRKHQKRKERAEKK